MPEGDILRRTAARLELALTGQVLTRAELRWPTVATVDLVGRTVLETVAYGKHLLTRFDDGRTLHTHLRMDGSWRVARTGSPSGEGGGPYVRVILGSATWSAIGTRIGMLDVVRSRDEHLVVGHLGPDVLAPDFPAAGLAEARRRLGARGAEPIAELLLDQRIVAGIGTLYAAETLFVNKVWPWTQAGAVEEPDALLLAARAMMLRSVAARLPTATGDVSPGRTSRVHARAGLPCRRCGTAIAVDRAGTAPLDRPIFYCPACQSPAGTRD